MNKDIRLDCGFWEHPKVVKLERRLGLPACKALQKLWIFCAKCRPNGDITSLDDEDFEIATGYKDDEFSTGSTLKQTLIEIGFLDAVENFLLIHDWFEINEYASHAPERSAKGKVAAAARWKKRDVKTDSNTTSNATSIQQVLPQAQSSNAPIPIPIPIPIPKPVPVPVPEHSCSEGSEKASGLFEKLVGLRSDFDPIEFLKQNSKQQFHPKAFLDVGLYLLKALSEKTGDNGSAKYVIDNPYKYGRALLRKYSANHYEAESIEKNNNDKKGLKLLSGAIA
jgi:hypothetical protein